MNEVRIGCRRRVIAVTVHEGVVFLQVDVAVRFAERRLRLERRGVDQAFDHDLGFRRHHADRRSCARTTLIGAPASAPATASSSRLSGIFCTEA